MPSPGAGVEDVVERAQRADQGQGGQRREGRGVDQPEDEGDGDDDADDEQAAHRGRAFLRVVRLGPVEADALAEAQRA